MTPIMRSAGMLSTLLFLTGGEATPGIQLAGFQDLLRLATQDYSSQDQMQDRADRSLANTYPFHLGEKQSSPGHTAKGRGSTPRVSPSAPSYSHQAQSQFGHGEAGSTSSVISAARAPAVQSSSFGSSLTYPSAAQTNYQAQSPALGSSYFQPSTAQTNHQAQAGLPASSFHLNLQSQSQAQAGFSLLAGFGSRVNPTSQYQIGSAPQSPQYNYGAGQLAAATPSYGAGQIAAAAPYYGTGQVAAAAPSYGAGQVAAAAPYYGAAQVSVPSYQPAPVPVPAFSQFSNFPLAASAPEASYAFQGYHENEVTVNNDAVLAAARVPSQCPAAPTLSIQQCQGAVNTCWSVGVSDVDCPGYSLCCFDGCANVCSGQARAVARPAPSFVNPDRRRNPAQKRRKPAGQTFKDVAAAGQRCIDKIEQVEEIEYDEVEQCDHSYDKKCHTSYSTEYEAQQEEECDDNYKKSCDITYSPQAQNVTVSVCMTPLVKDCNISGPEVCRTEYISECWTKNDPHIVEDDVPSCRTEYEEKCIETQSGYVTEQECSKWPREVCTVRKEIRAKFNPVTKCEKVPQELCGPSGCGFVPGPEECHDQVKTVVTDIPSEVCDLQPQRKCAHVTKLVPKLTPVEECVDVPKEICRKTKGNPRTVLKPVTKKWCYTPSQELGLA